MVSSRVGLSDEIVRTQIPSEQKRLVTSRVVDNIVPGAAGGPQPVFKLSHNYKLINHPIVENHRVVIQKPGKKSAAQRKRESRARSNNREKENQRRKRKTDEVRESETKQEREKRKAEQREAYYRHKEKKARDRANSINSDEIVFVGAPALYSASSSMPFYTINQASGEYRMKHTIERFEIHNFEHSYGPVVTPCIPSVPSGNLFTLQMKDGIRQLVQVTAVLSNGGSPYETILPIHNCSSTNADEFVFSQTRSQIKPPDAEESIDLQRS